VSSKTTVTRFSVMWVRALVGPRPVYSCSRRTVALEISAATDPLGLFSVLDTGKPLSRLPPQTGPSEGKEEDEWNPAARPAFPGVPARLGSPSRTHVGQEYSDLSSTLRDRLDRRTIDLSLGLRGRSQGRAAGGGTGGNARRCRPDFRTPGVPCTEVGMSVAESSYAKSVENFSQYLEPQLAMQDAICAGRHALVLTGEMDMASCPHLNAALAHICTGEANAVVLDLRKVAFIDSTGIKTILDAKKLSEQNGCEFSLIPGRAAVQRIFEVCGLLDHLPFREHASSAPESSGGLP
jgi:anti-anti-sigma factor